MRRRPRLFIHIGTGKTGTTALQSFWHDNRAALASQDLIYPQTGLFERGRAHHVLSHKWGGWLTTAQLAGRRIDDEWRALAKEVANSTASFLISSERFTAATLDTRHSGMIDFIKTLFADRADITVLVYLRPQEELAESLYKQGVKFGTIKTGIENFIASLPAYFDYSALLHPWSEAFGHHNILVRRYVPSAWPNGDLISDMLNVLGIVSSPAFIRSEPIKNPSIGTTAARLIIDLNLNADPRRRRLRRAIWEHLPAGGFLIGAETRRVIRDRYAASNAEVARKYMNGDQRLFPDPSTTEAPNDPSVSYDELRNTLQATIDETLRG
jgi:hypothetical protein